eukprot:753336-Hanusia_phi.AAC.3
MDGENHGADMSLLLSHSLQPSMGSPRLLPISTMPFNIHGLTLQGFEGPGKPASQMALLLSPQDESVSTILKKRKLEAKEETDLEDSDMSSSKSSDDQKESDRAKLRKLAFQHEELKARLAESESELDRLRVIVADLLEDNKERKHEESIKHDAPRRYWLQEEHDKFLEALRMYGPKAMKAISDHVRTRTPVQVRTHAQKYFQKLARMSMQGGHTSGSSSDTLDDIAI